MTINVGIAIDGYLKLRRAMEDLKEEQKLAMAPYLDKKLKLEGWLMQQLDAAGVDSLSARGVGTVFKQTTTSITAEEWDATLQWIKDNNAWEMLEHRVSKSAAMDYIEAHGEIPPGLKVTQDVEVRIRKG